MAGMHRDKGGAAAVAGFMHAVNVLKPSNIKIIAGLAMVRNSVGSEAYLADEIITARSGKRVRVGNTDAEGRMAMVDLLCHAKERCIKVSFSIVISILYRLYINDAVHVYTMQVKGRILNRF